MTRRRLSPRVVAAVDEATQPFTFTAWRRAIHKTTMQRNHSACHRMDASINIHDAYLKQRYSGAHSP